jgi:hypothetical protein
MTTVNVPLQNRAGKNVGNQPLHPFVHGAAMPETPVNTSGKTTLMEGQKNVVRTPTLPATVGSFGFVSNQSVISYDYTPIFVDNEGNEMVIGPATTVAAGAVGILTLSNPFLDGAFLGLCEGEKIVLGVAVTPAPPPPP